MQNKLKGWITPNSVMKDPNDKILILDAAGNVTLEQVYKEMREETLVHVVNLYERIIARFLMNGYNVNTSEGAECNSNELENQIHSYLS